MDLSNIQNSKTNEVIILPSDSSTASPARIVTSSSPKDFMEITPKLKKHKDNIVNKIKTGNEDFVEQNPQNTNSDSETDSNLNWSCKLLCIELNSFVVMLR